MTEPLASGLVGWCFTTNQRYELDGLRCPFCFPAVAEQHYAVPTGLAFQLEQMGTLDMGPEVFCAVRMRLWKERKEAEFKREAMHYGTKRRRTPPHKREG
jgi:hypothetical protein